MTVTADPPLSQRRRGLLLRIGLLGLVRRRTYLTPKNGATRSG
jgi:hypothetical protein